MIREIDVHNEHMIPIKEVPSYLPKRSGKKTHYQTVYRWVTKGTKGSFLASVKIGGVRYTSLEALRRFVQQQNRTIQFGEYQDAIDEELAQLGV